MSTFRFAYMTITQLGELFGVTSHQMGERLVQIGFRTESKRPSAMAFDNGFVEKGPSRGQGYNWVWHTEKTVAALEATGHRRVFPAPLGLVEPSPLAGPFEIKIDGGNFRIENQDGETLLLGQGAENGKLLHRILALADRHGVFRRGFDTKGGQ